MSCICHGMFAMYADHWPNPVFGSPGHILHRTAGSPARLTFGNIWPGITADEEKSETLRRPVESSQPGNK